MHTLMSISHWLCRHIQLHTYIHANITLILQTHKAICIHSCKYHTDSADTHMCIHACKYHWFCRNIHPFQCHTESADIHSCIYTHIHFYDTLILQTHRAILIHIHPMSISHWFCRHTFMSIQHRFCWHTQLYTYTRSWQYHIDSADTHVHGNTTLILQTHAAVVYTRTHTFNANSTFILQTHTFMSIENTTLILQTHSYIHIHVHKNTTLTL